MENIDADETDDNTDDKTDDRTVDKTSDGRKDGMKGETDDEEEQENKENGGKDDETDNEVNIDRDREIPHLYYFLQGNDYELREKKGNDDEDEIQENDFENLQGW